MTHLVCGSCKCKLEHVQTCLSRRVCLTQHPRDTLRLFWELKCRSMYLFSFLFHRYFSSDALVAVLWCPTAQWSLLLTLNLIQPLMIQKESLSGPLQCLCPPSLSGSFQLTCQPIPSHTQPIHFTDPPVLAFFTGPLSAENESTIRPENVTHQTLSARAQCTKRTKFSTSPPDSLKTHTFHPLNTCYTISPNYI